MNHRLTIAAATAVILASASEWVLIMGGGWLAASIGAVIVVALAGTLTRLAPTQAAIGATVLAALASAPLLFDKSLYLKLAGLVVIGCCAASASRVRVLRPIADLVTYLATLLLYLNLTLSNSKSFALLVPTSKSLRHLATLVNDGGAVAKNAPPVHGTPGVILLAAGSIGLAAIVVDVLAVRLRKPAIAGLPLLVIYMAPIATAAKIGGVSGIITFVFAGIGYLALLASDGRHRLRGWGRVVTVWHYAGEDDRLGGADVRGLAATGRRIGFAALCAAIAAPLLLPSLNLHRLFDQGHGGPVVNVALPDAVDQMRALLTNTSNSPVLSYQAHGADPGQYLQVYVLNYSSSQGKWTLVQLGRSITVGQQALLQPPGVDPSAQFGETTTTIKLGNVSGTSRGYNSPVFFLPVPYWPIQLNVNGTWNESGNSLMVYSGNTKPAGTSYTVLNGQVEPTKAEEASTSPIPPDIVKNYTQFHSPVTPELKAIAQRVTKRASTPFAKAIALENYFQTGGFTYNLHGPDLPNTAGGVLTFLTTDKQGFCEQFAFAMAVLARLVGIPSRIAIGYTAGTKQANGTWSVTTADAHSWPELYFPQIGWLRFEPTPVGPHGQGTGQQPTYATGGGSGGQPGSSPSTGTSGNQHSRSGLGPLQSHVRQPGTGSGQVGHELTAKPPTPHAPVPIAQILLGLLALLIIAGIVPGTMRIVGRRRRWRAAASDSELARAAWQEICADLDDFGLPRKLSESPRATARRISVDANIDDTARQAIGRIATVVERCRYAPVPASAAGIRADVNQVRRSLARSAGTLQRLRARFVPASVVRPMFGTLRESVSQRTGWIPSATHP